MFHVHRLRGFSGGHTRALFPDGGALPGRRDSVYRARSVRLNSRRLHGLATIKCIKTRRAACTALKRIEFSQGDRFSTPRFGRLALTRRVEVDLDTFYRFYHLRVSIDSTIMRSRNFHFRKLISLMY